MTHDPLTSSRCQGVSWWLTLQPPAPHVQTQYMRCTLREMLFWKRTVAANSGMLAPYSAAFKAKLLGKLNPSMWELSVLMPPKAPTTSTKQAERELRAAKRCRYCP
jgi:hypothetical protein